MLSKKVHVLVFYPLLKFFVLQELFALNILLVDNPKEMKRKTVDITDQQNPFQQSLQYGYFQDICI